MNFVALQLFRIPETRRRILTTLALLVAYRVGSSRHPERVVEFLGWDEWVPVRG